MLVGLYVAAELIEGFIVVLFFKVGEFMDDDHVQEFNGSIFKHGGDTDLV